MTASRLDPPGTTWFLRDKAEMDVLIAALRRDSPPSRQVRLWSVGCSTGQEPYSLAMAALEAGLLPHILATDIRKGALATAAAARYPAAAASALPTRWRQRYTTLLGSDEILINPAVSARVSFQLHDIGGASEPPLGWGRFDAVICRNVLIYFERAQAIAIVGRLAAACRSGGYVLLSAVERPLAWMSGVLGEDPDFTDAVLLRCIPSKVPPAVPPPPAFPTGRTTPGMTSSPPDAVTPSLSVGEALAEATTRMHRGELACALQIVDEILARDPLAAPAHLLRGLALKHSGRALEATAALRSARYLYSDDAWMPPYQLGLLLEQLGHPAEAGEAYRHALLVIRAGARSGLPVEGQAEDALPATVAEACQARLRALAKPKPR